MAQEFWDEAQDMIICTEKHPFLVSMVDGSLSLDHFQYYVIQDALYLKDFADCLRRLSANVGVSVEDSRQLEGFATGAEEAEMCLHESFFQK